jgi:hypothetical protein
MLVIVAVVGLTMSATEYKFDANETIKLLNETCSKNNGIETTKVSANLWSFKCKDGAKFTIKR